MRPTLSILLLFVFTGIYSQTFNSVKIDLNGKPITELAKLGLDVEHGQYAKGKHFIGVFSNEELDQIQQAGFEYKTLIENLSDHVRNHHHESVNSASFRNPGPCEAGDNTPELEVPENFQMGSFAGFFTYDEMLDNLDAMVAQYPNLITIKAPIDTFLTHEGRPIYWVKISDNPNDDEAEPEILYTAVHHAREPGGMSGLIYFMWHILENYDSDPQVQSMVNETELYLIPCLNPDGYIFNEDNYFNGGSIYWRKNRRDNGDGTYGVDLNRNYGYEFGYDDNGSSPNTDAATYRGPSGFSEPETQASEAFCNAHEFQIALNYHTFGNLLIYPWGYDNVGVADPIFPILANEIVAGNNFFPGTALETVGYVANGSSDDWMYGENVTKPAVFAMSPELGLGGFYPPESEIMGIVQSALGQNMSTSLLAHSYAQIADLTNPIISSVNPQEFSFKLTNAGLEGGDFAVTLNAVSNNFDAVGDTKNFNIPSQGSVEDFISFNLNNDILAGEEVLFALSVDNGSYVITDTISKIFGITEVLFSDIADNLDNWTSVSWATTDEDFVSTSTSFTDSPGEEYSPNTTNYITSNPISLADAQGAFLNFWAKWDIEAGWDYTQVSISIDGGITFEPQCGLYTKAGNGNQDEGQPLYDGTQTDWVKEQINLSDYLGQEIRIRFSLVSDNGVEEDGFYFDDLEVITILDSGVSTQPLVWSNLQVSAYPNPASDQIHLELSAIIPHSKLLFYNALGGLVYEQDFENESLMKIQVQHWADGIYFYELINKDSGNKTTGKVFVK
jgi:carboxypeptidase T